MKLTYHGDETITELIYMYPEATEWLASFGIDSMIEGKYALITVLKQQRLDEQLFLNRLDTALRVFQSLRSTLMHHFAEEREWMFPMVLQQEHVSEPELALAVKQAYRTLVNDHQQILRLLQVLRDITTNDQLPAWSSWTYANVIQALEHLDQDVQHYVNWEKHVLFPRMMPEDESSVSVDE